MRVLAAMVALSVGILQAQAQAFHVHRAPDHPREARHAHAPAIHHHRAPDSDHHSRLIDPEEMTASITLMVPAAAAPGQVFLVVGETPTIVAVAQAELAGRMLPVEVRSHGPPSAEWRPSFRGPPYSF